MKSMNSNIILNVIGFYVCWWMTIFGAISETYFIGPLLTLVFVILHLYKITNHRKEDIFLVISFFLGLFIESLLLNCGIIIHKGVFVKFNLAPLWAVSLWVCFASTLLHSFKWLSKQYLISALLGILSAPMIYFSMESLGVISFEIDKVYIALFVSVLWGLFMPLFIYISDKILEL